MKRLKSYLALISISVVGCAASPKFDTANVNKTLTPAQALANMETRGSRVLWGGVIVGTTNLEGKTRFEILSYPLTKSQRPNSDADQQGRFLAFKDGYIETLDYAPGKPVTLIGTLTGTRNGHIGESPYVYPVVDVESIYLWSDAETNAKPRVNFGIGIMLNN